MEKAFTKFGANLSDLDAAWQDRLADAEALFAARRNAWAVATALYALEIRLKVLICKRLELRQLPRAFEIHDLAGLLIASGLSRRLQQKSAAKVKKNWDDILLESANLNEIRYRPDKSLGHKQAAKFFQQLKDPPDGVLPWLSKQK